jgi:type II secretory pathway component PulF
MESMNLKIRPSTFLETIAWFLAVALFIFLAYVSYFDWDDYGPLIIFLPIWILAPYLLVLDYIRSARRKRAAIVLAHVEEGVRLNLPLAPLLLAAADSESYKVRNRLLRLHDRLDQGEELGHALYYAVPEIPAPTARAVHAAGKIGRLPQMMRRLVRHAIPRQRIVPQIDRFYRNYAVFISIFLLSLVCGMIGLIVMPKFVSIFHDFHATLPWTTKLLVDFCNSYIPFFLVGIILLIAIFPWRGTPRDIVIYYTPVLGGMVRDQGMADLCAFLVDALEAGQPMNESLFEAAEAQSNAVLRRRVRKWAAAATAGQPIQDAARRANMPPIVSGMLNTVHGNDDMVQVMAFLSRHFEFRFSRWREIMRAAGIPLFVGAAGSIVFMVELSVFQPIINLINVVAEPIHRHIGGF